LRKVPAGRSERYRADLVEANWRGTRHYAPLGRDWAVAVNFTFFEQMSADEAHAFLADYCEYGAANAPALYRAARVADVDGFALSSLPLLFRSVARGATVLPRDPDPELPRWITESESYAAGLYDLGESTARSVFVLSFVLGEAFVRAFHLRWAIGDSATAEANQPVVTGFRAGVEMAPILVAENLVRSLVQGDNE
jgi:hypothetical protein